MLTWFHYIGTAIHLSFMQGERIFHESCTVLCLTEEILELHIYSREIDVQGMKGAAVQRRQWRILLQVPSMSCSF